jgi:hypothetical protein
MLSVGADSSAMLLATTQNRQGQPIQNNPSAAPQMGNDNDHNDAVRNVRCRRKTPKCARNNSQDDRHLHRNILRFVSQLLA